MWRIRYPPGAHFLRVSQILHVIFEIAAPVVPVRSVG